MPGTMIRKAAEHTKSFKFFPNNESNDVTTPDFEQPLTLYSALKLAVELEAKRVSLVKLVKELEQEVRSNAEKAELYDDLANTDELYNTNVVAKSLHMGNTKFRQLLRKLKVLMPSGFDKNLPLQKHIDAGRLDVRWVEIVDSQTGERKPTPIPLFTGKGIIWIKKLIEKNARLAA